MKWGTTWSHMISQTRKLVKHQNIISEPPEKWGYSDHKTPGMDDSNQFSVHTLYPRIYSWKMLELVAEDSLDTFLMRRLGLRPRYLDKHPKMNRRVCLLGWSSTNLDENELSPICGENLLRVSYPTSAIVVISKHARLESPLQSLSGCLGLQKDR